MNTFSRSLRTCLPGILILVSLQGYAQEIVKPNYGLKNPETIEVVRVRISADQTLVDMSI
jgi:hypothetical protein